MDTAGIEFLSLLHGKHGGEKEDKKPDQKKESDASCFEYFGSRSFYSMYLAILK